MPFGTPIICLIWYYHEHINLDSNEQTRITETDLEDVLVITRDTYNRFRVYKKLFKPNKAFVFRDKTLKVDNHGRYGSTNKYYKLRKEI